MPLDTLFRRRTYNPIVRQQLASEASDTRSTVLHKPMRWSRWQGSEGESIEFRVSSWYGSRIVAMFAKRRNWMLPKSNRTKQLLCSYTTQISNFEKVNSARFATKQATMWQSYDLPGHWARRAGQELEAFDSELQSNTFVQLAPEELTTSPVDVRNEHVWSIENRWFADRVLRRRLPGIFQWEIGMRESSWQYDTGRIPGVESSLATGQLVRNNVAEALVSSAI